MYDALEIFLISTCAMHYPFFSTIDLNTYVNCCIYISHNDLGKQCEPYTNYTVPHQGCKSNPERSTDLGSGSSRYYTVLVQLVGSL